MAKKLARRGSGNSLVVHQSISGPIPSPQILAGYEQILPGAAERVVAMAEKEQEHRHRMESRMVSGTLRTVLVGQVLGGALGLVVCTGGTWAIIQGQATGGAVAVVSALASMVGAFLLGRKSQAGTPPPAQER